jgi:hypothetical protein
MRFAFATVSLLAMIILAAGAAYAADPSETLDSRDLVMRVKNGKLTLMHEYELAPRIQYALRFKFMSESEVVGEAEIWTIHGLPAVITSAVDSVQRGEKPVYSDPYWIVIETPDVAHPPTSWGPKLDAVPDWDRMTEVNLHELKIFIDYPGADWVKISAERQVRPAAVIDDQEGNIIFEMHYPDELPLEPYGEVWHVLRHPEPRQLTRSPFGR